MSVTDINLFLPQILLIAGQQQNVGKTMLACKIIAHFSRSNKITAFKVSPHFHQNTGKAAILKSGKGWQILKETDENSNKDTGRMLQAGAEDAYFLQADEEHLLLGFQELMKLVPGENTIVCESARLREYIHPGVFLFLRQLSCRICSIEDEKLIQSADRLVTFTTNGFDFSIDDLSIFNGQWGIRQ